MRNRRAVEHVERQLGRIEFLDASKIDPVVAGLAHRLMEGIDAAGLAEMVLRNAAAELVGRQMIAIHFDVNFFRR